MTSVLFLLALAQTPAAPVYEFFGKDVGLRLNKQSGEIVMRLYAKDTQNRWRQVLASPTATGIPIQRGPRPTSVRASGDALFAETPTLCFQTWSQSASKDSVTVRLQHQDENQTTVLVMNLPAAGTTLSVSTDIRFTGAPPAIEYALASFAFVPDGQRQSLYKRPESTFSPGLRSKTNQVVGDHFFRCPGVSVQHGPIAAALLPDVDSIAKNRSMPMILDIDCKSGVADAPLLSYGFCDHRLDGHVSFVRASNPARRGPDRLHFDFDVWLSAKAEPFGAYSQIARHTWNQAGHRYYEAVLPQAMPFADYAKVSYPAAFNEAYGSNKLGWTEVEIDGQPCGYVPAGWGFTNGWVSWQDWFNQLRSAWGLRWWGKQLGEPDWVQKSDKMLNLALAAPMDRGAAPTTWLGREKKWKGCLITPDPTCYYDLTNLAWKGIWFLHWLEFQDCPRRTDVVRQSVEMAKLMLRHQNADGSIPTWLTLEHKVVPILDHSAQTSLPIWFLVECLKSPEVRAQLDQSAVKTAIRKGADFLTGVVDGQYYYDFETFFSCSPKACKGNDHDAMRDPHTLCPPQNTLSMQWCAEALAGADAVLGLPSKYRPHAFKALDMMCLYQNTWPISYRKVAYTYGGFGVQNSDGEYDDARQAQFGATLADFGATFGSSEYFERGVAATRASMALINHPMHAENGIYPNPNYPLGLQPENCAHGGFDHQAGRTGFDWGEGSGLASMAWLLHKYGGVYSYNVNGKQWTVGIDGVDVTPDGLVWSPIYSLKKPWDQNYSVTVKGKSVPVAKGAWFGEPELSLSATGATLTASLKVDGAPTGAFHDESGRALATRFNNSGEQRTVTTDLGPASGARTIQFKGAAGKLPIVSRPMTVWIDPSFALDPVSFQSWTVQGDFADLPTYSSRMDFGIASGPFIGTCEDGKGGFEDAYTGTIESPAFLATKPTMKLLVGGGSGDGVYVELVDVATDQRLAIARGQNRERMRSVTWDLKPFKGKMLKIRIVDKEKGGWGHINVGQITASG